VPPQSPPSRTRIGQAFSPGCGDAPDPHSFTIGGYPVVKKWLDYRHIEKLGRPLRSDEVRYVCEMAQRIAALLALGPALDASYAAIKAQTLALGPVPAC